MKTAATRAIGAGFAAGTVLALITTAAAPALSAEGRLPIALLMQATGSEAAPAAAVASEVPFSRSVNLSNCNGASTSCFVRLPRLLPKEQWALQFVSCTADAAATSTFRHFEIQVADATETRLLAQHFIAATYQSDRLNGVGVNVASQPLVLTIRPNSVVYLVASAIGNLGGARCAISGLKQTLD